jgi:predicted AlkP superfamily pyrophosphatase or phosphodiesterase
MDWYSHGFEFLFQVHDSFVCQLNTRHSNWKEGVHNLLHVMNRPIIINGHTVRVRTEAMFGQRWGKDVMHEWNGMNPFDLDRVAITTN